MRYLLAVIDDETNSGNADEFAAIDAFNAQLRASGQLILATGVTAPHNAILVDNRGEANIVVDGPVNDTVEYTSGFWIIEAPDDDIAQSLALQASSACNRRIEIRRFL